MPVFADASLLSELCLVDDVDNVLELGDDDGEATVAVEAPSDLVATETMDAGSTLCLVGWPVVLDCCTEISVS